MTTDNKQIPGIFIQEEMPAGRPNGCMILIHGSESHSGWFSSLSKHLVSMGYRTVNYDRRGSGQSEGNRGVAEDIETLRRQLHQIIAEVAEVAAVAAVAGVEVEGKNCPVIPVHLVGLSWGGLFAANSALDGRLPEVSTISLLSPGIFPLPRFSIGACLKILFCGLFGLDSMVRLPWAPEDFSGKDVHKTFIGQDPLRTTSVNAKFLWQAFQMQRQIKKSRAKFAGMKVQIVLSEKDSIISTSATKKFAEVTGCKLTVIHDSAHSLVLDAPEATAKAIAAWALDHHSAGVP